LIVNLVVTYVVKSNLERRLLPGAARAIGGANSLTKVLDA